MLSAAPPNLLCLTEEEPPGVAAHDRIDLLVGESFVVKRRIELRKAVGDGETSVEPPLVEDAPEVGTDAHTTPVTRLTQRSEMLHEHSIEPRIEWLAWRQAHEPTALYDLDRLHHRDATLDFAARQRRVVDTAVTDPTMGVGQLLSDTRFPTFEHLYHGLLAHVRQVEPPATSPDLPDEIPAKMGDASSRLFRTSTNRIVRMVDGRRTPHAPPVEQVHEAPNVGLSLRALEPFDVEPVVRTELPRCRCILREQLRTDVIRSLDVLIHGRWVFFVDFAKQHTKCSRQPIHAL